LTLAARPLSAREMDVVRLVVEGRSNRQISDDLLVSSDTVKTHLRNIFRKCEVRNRAGLVAWWFERFNLTAQRVGAAVRKGHAEGGADLRRPVIAWAGLAAIVISLAIMPLWAGPGMMAGTSPGTINVDRTRWSGGSAVQGDRGLAACSSASSIGGRAVTEPCVAGITTTQELPAVAITSPGEGDQVAGPDVEVRVAVSDFVLVPPSGTGATPGQGHVIYYLDFEPAFVPGQSAIPTDPTVDYAATDLVTHTFENVAPGPHGVVVMLVQDDHTPVVPPAINSVRFTVIPFQETPAPRPSPASIEIARTISIDQAVVQTPRAAVLPVVMPAVGGSGDMDAGSAPHVADIVWPLAAGAALILLGGAIGLAYTVRRNHRW